MTNKSFDRSFRLLTYHEYTNTSTPPIHRFITKNSQYHINTQRPTGTRHHSSKYLSIPKSTRPVCTIPTVILILSRQKDLEWAHKSRLTIFYANYNHSRPYYRNELFKAPIIHRSIMWRTCTRLPTSQLPLPRMLATQKLHVTYTGKLPLRSSNSTFPTFSLWGTKIPDWGSWQLFPKSTSSTSTKSPLQAENIKFFWQGHGQKVPLRMHQNTPFQVKILLLGEGHSPSPDPSQWE